LLPHQTDDLQAAWRRGLCPPPRLTLVEWADKYRYLSKESSGGGKFHTSRVEVARGPMLAVTEPGVQTITLKACTQLLKTTFMENVAGFFIHSDPCPILVVQPKQDAAETFSKDRLAPMIRDTPVLKDIFGSGKQRDAGDTLTHKQFPGGHITMVGAHSPTDLAMRPIRVTLCDEIDKYPLSAGNEGPPVDLAEERQAEFSANKLAVRACSPTDQNSAIDASYQESDQRKAFVACPHCSAQQVLEWENVRYDKDERDRPLPDSARYACVECCLPWSEADRLRTLQKITWRQTREFDCCGKHQKPERWICESAAPGIEYAACIECGKRAVPNEHAGFVASKLYAPKQSIRELVKKFRRALERGAEALKTFNNTQLARIWRVAGEAPKWETVYERRDAYASGSVPLGALILFAGVDLQKDRIEVGIWGFGRARQRWLIEHRVLPGSPTRPEVWAELEKLFQETWRHETGAEMAVRDWGIDSGAYPSEVAAFVRSQQGRGNVHAVDGLDRYQGAFIAPGKMDVSAGGKKLRRGLTTARIGVSFCKQELVGQLGLDKPTGDNPYPPGFVHLPQDLSEDHAKQLTAEELVTRVKKGRTKREWQIVEGRRNEVLDCANYARGLAAMRGWDRWKEARFAELEALLKAVASSEIVAAGGAEAPAAESPSAAASGRSNKWIGRHSGWLGSKRD
jgi:phage terminase large subunit GpA-like protein